MDLTQVQLDLAELYTITLKNGAVARFTSHDEDITYGVNTWQAIPIMRTPAKYHSDLTVDKVQITAALVGVQIGTEQYTMHQVIRRDFLREAHVKIELINFETLEEPDTIFEGFATGNIAYSDGILTVDVGSLLDRLQDKFPKLLYSEHCNHQVFNSHCGLDKDSWKVNGTAIAAPDSSASSRIYVYASILEYAQYAQDYWKKGEIQMTSGNNNGVSRTVYFHGDGYIKVLVPFPENVEVDDTFWIVPGCDLTGKTCADKFSNYANFFGFEYTPKPDTLYG